MKKPLMLRGATSWSPLLIRIALGIIFIYAGSQKLFGTFGGPGIEGFAGFLASLGLPLPMMMAVLVGLFEFTGGILVLVGLGTRIFAGFIALIMLNATLLVHIKDGFGASRLTIVLFLVAEALVYLGAGSISFDAVIKGRPRVEHNHALYDKERRDQIKKEIDDEDDEEEKPVPKKTKKAAAKKETSSVKRYKKKA